MKDNELQMNWVKLLKPVKAMIKFKCPYPDKKLEYNSVKMLKGDMLI